MTARLISLDGNAEIPLDRPLLLVGRDARCDARIDSPRVSRVHCFLAEHGGTVTVRDLGSTNGISVNGRRAAAFQLRAGDVLAIADFRYRLEPDPRSGAFHDSPRDGDAGAATRNDPGAD
jgi:pSer/pThr/pTyr-binding forkhead associated (FHA) protein